MTHEAKHCPKCGGEAVPIIYSAPLLVPGGSRPDIFKAEDRGELRWGGCLIDSGSPGWYCKKWDLSFGGRDDVHVAKQGSEPHPTVPTPDHIRLATLASRPPSFSGAALSAEMGPAEMLGRSPYPWYPTLRRPCGTPVEPSHVNARARSKKIQTAPRIGAELSRPWLA